MKEHTHRYDYPLAKEYLRSRTFCSGECEALMLAEKAGRCFILSDGGALADFVEEDDDRSILDSLIHVYEFDTLAERNAYLEKRGWLAWFSGTNGEGRVFSSVLEYYSPQLSDFCWARYQRDGRGAAVVTEEEFFGRFLKDGSPLQPEYLPARQTVDQYAGPRAAEFAKLLQEYDPWTAFSVVFRSRDGMVANFCVAPRPSVSGRDSPGDAGDPATNPGQAFAFISCEQPWPLIERAVIQARDGFGDDTATEVRLCENNDEFKRDNPLVWATARHTRVGYIASSGGREFASGGNTQVTAAELPWVLVGCSHRLDSCEVGSRLSRILWKLRQGNLYGPDDVVREEILYPSVSGRYLTLH